MKKLSEIKTAIKKFFDKYVFNVKWRCNDCGKEIFEEKAFCDKCEKELPYIQGAICNHCGRSVLASEEYCSTCKDNLISIDKGRSVFNYDKSVIKLIHNFKYNGCGYLKEVFAEYLYGVYIQNRFDADIITFVPMTEKSKRRRGYNQSELLANCLGKMLNVDTLKLLDKVKETPRQATMNRKERLSNLVGAFRVKSRKLVKDKNVMIIDDVTTTGSTAQAVASKLKKAGAKRVYLLTVASVPPVDKY